MSGFGSAISEHPITPIATGEVTGAVLEAVGDRPGLAVCFVTPAHGGALEDVVRTVDEILRPEVLIGAVARSVIGPGREVESGPAISLWAAATGPFAGIRLHGSDDVHGHQEGPPGITGWPEDVDMDFDPVALLLLADRFSFPAEDLLSWLDDRYPGMPVVGGLASAAHRPGGNSLSLGRAVQHSGAVGVFLGDGVVVDTVVSQGSRPFGRPFVVTRSDENIIYELAGKPALERLVSQANSGLNEEEVEVLAQGGLQIGRVVNEHLEEFTTGDFIVRNVLGSDRKSGAIAVGDVVPVGVTVQFHLRDAVTAGRDLARRLAGKRADAALLFTCTGRGTNLFGSPDHDATAIVEQFGPIPTAGCFAAGEIGPVAGRNFLHGFTASMVLFQSGT